MKPPCGSMLLLVLMLLLGSLVSHVESHGDTVVSICKDAKAGDWRKKLFQLCWLLEIPIEVDEAYCPGINGNQYAAISISRGLQGIEEVVKEYPGKNEEDYFKQVVSKLTENRIISVSESILMVLKNVDQAIVGFVDDIDSKEQQVFQQAALAATLPEDMKVYQLTNKNFLPSHAQSQVKGVIHVWVVTNGKWCHLPLPEGQSFVKLFHGLIEPFNRLQYPSKFIYNPEDPYEEYIIHGFHLFIVYHRTNQLDTINQIVIDPLVNVFRPYFAFITFNVEQYETPIDIPDGPFPYITILKHGEITGLHFDSLYRPRSFETFSNILEEIINPRKDTPTSPGTIITHIDIGTLQDISDRIDTSAAAGLCKKGSFDCIMMEEKIRKTLLALQRLEKEFEMTFYIVECKSVADISIARVPKLPYIIAKETSKEWTLYSDTVNVPNFIKIMQTYGSVLNKSKMKNASVDVGESLLSSRKRDNSIVEDDLVALLFPKYFSIPSILPILTNNNYTQYIEQNENCLVAFYVPFGISPSVVNCAEYPDVCEAFDVYHFPIVKYRIGLNSEWVTYRGVFSDLELVKLVDSSLKETMDAATKDKTIQELTPSVLLSLLKSDKGLTTLLVLVTAEEMAQPLRETLSSLADNQVYWLNSTRYSKLSQFYVGSLEPPVLVWADYVKLSLHRLDIKKPVAQQQLESFINDVHNGKALDEEIPHHDWGPLSPPIEFPSNRFIGLGYGKDEDDDGSYKDEPHRVEHVDDEAHIPVSTYHREQGIGEEGTTTLDKEEKEQYGGHPSHRQEL